MKLIWVLIVVMFALTAAAASTGWTAQESSSLNKESPEKPLLKPSISGIFGGESNLYETSSDHHQSDLSLYLVPSLTFSEKYKASLLLLGSKTLTQKQEWLVEKTDIAFSYNSIKLSKIFNLSPSFTVILPVSREQSQNQSLIIGTKVGARFTYDLAPTKFKLLSGFIEFSGVQNFHTYSTAASSMSNNQNAFNIWITADIKIVENFSLGSSFVQTNTWSYKGASKESFKWEESLDYDLSKHWGLSASVSNSGGFLKVDGKSSNLSLIDENTTNLGLSVSFKY